MDRPVILQVAIVCLMLTVSPVTFAAKYPPINEIPDAVPADDLEREIWQVGKEHQRTVRSNGELIADPAVEQYLEDVVRRLMGSMVEDIGLQVEVLIFKDTTVNAWVYLDGAIGVQSGLLAAMENEAQLAAILAHEVSHFLNRHAYIQIRSKRNKSAIGKGLGILATAAVAAKTGSVDTNLMKVGEVYTELATSGYSRNLEKKADQQGLALMVAAGYPPGQALPAFEALRIPDDDKGGLSGMWSSHPDIDSRKKGLKKQIGKIKSAPEQIPDPLAYDKAIAPVLIRNAGLAMYERKFPQARAMLKRYIAARGNEPIGHFLVGEAYRKESPEGPDYSQRLAAYQQAISVDAGYAMAYKELGMAYRQQHKVTEAVSALQQFLSLKPNAADAGIIQWYVDDLLENGSPPASALPGRQGGER